MKEEDAIMQIRQLGPKAIRTCVEVARQTEDHDASRQAIAELASRGFLSTHQPTDDDLQKIEKMTDREILGVLRRGLH